MLLVAQAPDAKEAMTAFRTHRPDITLLDVRLPGCSGIDLLISLREEFPQARVIMLTTSETDGEIAQSLRAGAAAYLLKNTPKSDLLGVVRTVHAGNRYVPPDVAARIAEHLGDEPLTRRELDVLQLIQSGRRNKEIAGELGVTETTINFHIKNLVTKLQANDRTHAVAIAVRRGLLPL
jgi:DNA-binding NarL/FixJ family response regulator